MVPVCFPSKISSTTGLREAVVYALPSVTGLVRWTDYIPVKLVASADAALEGRTDAGGFIPMDMLVSNTGLMGWVDYLPVYIDNSATDAWAITATGFIPYAASGGGSSPAFTVTMTALSNALGTVTTLAYITGGAGPSDLATVMSTALSGGTVTGTGGITTATTGIASRTTGVAPMAVFFDATGTTNSLGIDNFADILYLWNFGDSETAWTYGTGVGDNSKNRARGGVAAHVYETAGTYTAKVTPVTVSSLGVLSYGTTTSISITVNAAARSGTTYIVSAAGDFTGAPAGTQVTTSNIATALGSGRLAANTRFLFKGGETFNFPSTVSIGVSGVTLGTWGTGKPTITHTGSLTDGLSLQNGIDDIIVMNWSLSAGTSGSGNVRWKNLFAVTPGTVGGRTNVLMLRVDTNKNSALYDSGWTDGVFIVDCNGQNFTGGNGNVALYAEISSRVAILGSRIYDATGVEHCLRMQGSTKMVISNNDIALPANNKAAVTIRGRSNQALTNDKTTWSGVWAEHVVISENNLTSRAGATWTVQFAPQDDADNGPVRDIIFERNFIDSGASTSDAVVTEGISGITVRNNLIKVGGAYNALLVLYRNIYVTEAPTDTKFYNNTLYRDTAASPTYINALFMQRVSGAASAAIPTGTVYKNNLFTGPTLSNAVLPGTNCGSTADVSHSSTAAQIYGTAGGFTIPPVNYVDWKATSGYSINGGTYVPVFDDFNGAARTGTYDIGAVNP